MEPIRKPLAVILALTAIAVLIHFIAGPFYQDLIESNTVWSVLNWFMAFGVIAALILTYMTKRTAPTEDCDTKTYIGVNTWFYSAAALTILYFWNWFNELASGGDSAGEVSGNFWVVIDTLYVILILRLSVDLWRIRSGSE